MHTVLNFNLYGVKLLKCFFYSHFIAYSEPIQKTKNLKKMFFSIFG